MKENIKESIVTAVEVIFVILSGLAGLWWGLRMGGGILRLTGEDFRPFLCFLMLAGLIYQGYSNLKSNRKYPPLYGILLWISGVLVSLLIYSWLFMIILDAVTLAVRLIRGITSSYSSGIFMDLRFGADDGHLPQIGLIRNGTIWNFGNAAVLALLLSVLVTVYGLIHARIIRVKFHEIRLKGLRAGTSAAEEKKHQPATAPRPCRIVHLSDLHMGSIVTPHYIRRVVEKVNALNPDYIMITGDLFNHGYVEENRHPWRLAHILREMNRHCLEIHPGSSLPRVLAVLGNHDPEPEDPPLRTFLEESGITLLYRETMELPEFILAGYGGLHVNHRPPILSWLDHAEAAASSKPIILLDHYPDSIHEAQEAGIDLMLSGHTHGGQYFPNNLLIWRHYARGRLMRGYSVWGHTQSIVSQGTGFFQVPIRIGTDSEILCLDLLPAESAESGEEHSL